MSTDFNTLASIWFVLGFVTTAWAIIDRFRGGKNSKYSRMMRVRFPRGVPITVFVSLAVGVVLSVIGWPFVLAAWGVEEWKSRKSRLLYGHPRLRTLAACLIKHDGDYAAIFDRCGLTAMTPALHAIDLTSVKRRDLTPIDATYGDIARHTGSYLLYVQKLKSGDPSEVTQARQLAAKAGANPESAAFSELSFAMGNLAIGYVHGRLPQAKLDEAKEVYVSHLLPQFNSDEHLRTVFSPIGSVTTS